MKYYLIVGEASGDLHASCLMESLLKKDPNAEFRFFGGDMMTVIGGVRVKHYRELAYMGIVPVILHLRTILRNMHFCKTDVLSWQPDALILVDYPGFNLSIAKYVRINSSIPIYYYISPKIWAWKEYRIKNIKRDVDQLFSILPFEIPFFEKKHHYPIHYVGNPTVEEVEKFKASYCESFEGFCSRNNLTSDKPIIALLAGSRKQEIKDNLQRMISAASQLDGYQMVLAGAPGIHRAYYKQFITENKVSVVFGETYPLLTNATVALVTSGTATLETALFRVPQVVCYYVSMGKLVNLGRRLFIHIKYVSLVNLIAEKEVVTELIADKMTVWNVVEELKKILPGQKGREEMLMGYKLVRSQLGDAVAPENAAETIVHLLKQR
jgi:lipid-A-disaccharide synthase